MYVRDNAAMCVSVAYLCTYVVSVSTYNDSTTSIKCNGTEIRDQGRIRYKCKYGQRRIRIAAVWDIIDILEVYKIENVSCILEFSGFSSVRGYVRLETIEARKLAGIQILLLWSNCCNYEYVQRDYRS